MHSFVPVSSLPAADRCGWRRLVFAVGCAVAIACAQTPFKSAHAADPEEDDEDEQSMSETGQAPVTAAAPPPAALPEMELSGAMLYEFLYALEKEASKNR